MDDILHNLSRIMTDDELQSGLNLQMVVFTFLAFLVWRLYRRWMRAREIGYPEGSEARQQAGRSRETMAAVVLSMGSGALLAGALVPYYLGKAAEIPWLIEFSRDAGLLMVANLAKCGVAIGAALHIKGWLRARFGGAWPAALAALMLAVFLFGALGPRLL